MPFRRWLLGAFVGAAIAAPFAWMAWEGFFRPSVETMFEERATFVLLPQWLVMGSAASVPIQFVIAVAVVGGWVQRRMVEKRDGNPGR